MRLFRVRYRLSTGPALPLLILATSTSHAIDTLYALVGDELTYFCAGPAR
jgi:hypothetical protein